ncbi:redoxin domain-containing protein [Sutcliffiella horikoshii]|uniref:redoxin domain-containing protein n=1 Tax=Sutcliffiella horikoshii TaxID=79883 RepID=UPI001CC0E62F|nr:redoxin domain-containing protein [Sutcliffiella horikoshii]UAL47937.1 redoxin domain-containing protein [Sutcliffiella horikoshii]
MNKNLLSIAIILLAVAIIFVNVWEKPASEENSEATSVDVTKDESIPGVDLGEVQEGNQAPDFTLTTLEGEELKLSDYRGKKVILNFWATWCPPCKAEMPHMQSFYEENHEEVEVIAVNLTNMDKGEEAINSFVEDYELTFAIPLDEAGDIGMQYQAFTIPTSYAIDEDGIIQKKIIGPMDEAMMKSIVDGME